MIIHDHRRLCLNFQRYMKLDNEPYFYYHIQSKSYIMLNYRYSANRGTEMEVLEVTGYVHSVLHD